MFSTESHCKRPLMSVGPPIYCVSVESYHMAGFTIHVPERSLVLFLRRHVN